MKRPLDDVENTPLEETCRAMSDLAERGKTLYWGVSEWTGPQIEAAISICEEAGWHRPISNQPIYNMLDRHWEEERSRMNQRALAGLGLVGAPTGLPPPDTLPAAECLEILEFWPQILTSP